LHVRVVPPAQIPAVQVVPFVQASLSLQVVPSTSDGCEQPVSGMQMSWVHGLVSAQFGAPAPVQVPLVQVSVTVQAFASLHGVPFVAGPTGVQLPVTQRSPVVHTLLSLHAVPFGRAVYRHVPVAGSHVSVVHSFSSLHVVVVPPPHTPAVQTVPLVQALLSLHAWPFGAFAYVQPLAGLHESCVHGLLSLQETAVPPQVIVPPPPDEQRSLSVQMLPSLQSELLAWFTWTQPPGTVPSQVSIVHELPSSQFGAAPPTQAPA